MNAKNLEVMTLTNNLANKKSNDNMKSFFSKYIKLIALILLSMFGVGQAWGQVTPMQLEIVKKNGVKMTYDMSTIKSVTIKEKGYKIASNGDTIRMVDLGLPSGTLWADRNIGSNCPAAAGNYYAWGETKTKNNYSENNYTFTTTKWSIRGTEDDAAKKNWGNDYMMPDSAQFVELCDSRYTSYKWVSMKDKKGKKVEGYKITSKSTGNSIFLPVTGYKEDDKVTHADDCDGRYWTATRGGRGQYSLKLDEAWTLGFLKTNPYMYFREKYIGHPIRPVSK